MGKTRFLILFLSTSILLLMLAAAFAVWQVRAQGDFATEFADRLEAQGVPVKSVVVVSRLPFAVEITLQSASDGETLEVTDVQHISLAEREAALAYRAGTRLDSYKVSLVNTSGEMIFGTQGFLYPGDPSQQQPVPAAPLVSDRDMEQAAVELLGLENLPGLHVERLAVIRMDTPGGQGQKLDLIVRMRDLSPGNQPTIRNLYQTFRGLLWVEEEPLAALIYGHLQILNPEGKVALDVHLDMETYNDMETAEAGGLEWLLSETRSGPLRIEDLTPSPAVYP